MENIVLGRKEAPLSVVANNPGVGEIDVIDLILQIGKRMDLKNISEHNRWIILPRWMKRMAIYALAPKEIMFDIDCLGAIDRFIVHMASDEEKYVFAGRGGSHVFIEAWVTPSGGR